MLKEPEHMTLRYQGFGQLIIINAQSQVIGDWSTHSEGKRQNLL